MMRTVKSFREVCHNGVKLSFVLPLPSSHFFYNAYLAVLHIKSFAKDILCKRYLDKNPSK